MRTTFNDLYTSGVLSEFYNVKDLQIALEAIGYALPKSSCSGEMNKETWSAVEEFADSCFDHSESIPETIFERIFETAKFYEETSAELVEVTGRANKANIKKWRDWKDITSIVLHQTGVWMTDTPTRFERLKAHIAILGDHKTPIVQVHPFTAYLYHANSLNSGSVGIEINGHFPGLAEDFIPEKHTAIGPNEEQITSTQKAIKLICHEVERHDGCVTHIHAHRQSSPNRRSDPGEIAWIECGEWARKELGLSSGGPGTKFEKGRPIPWEWTGKLATYKQYVY
jgi:N-acetyl-anhydromuramyl-L-alanine amidase AmpD